MSQTQSISLTPEEATFILSQILSPDFQLRLQIAKKLKPACMPPPQAQPSHRPPTQPPDMEILQ